MADPRVVIVGAGMSGLCMAVKLLDAGVRDLVLYEKAPSLGGTWRDNTYPGLTCDVPSRFYQYSFALNPGWTHRYSPGPEIRDYLERVADARGVRRHIVFGTEVTAAEHSGGRWRVTTTRGTDEADFLISATGVLHHPRHPDIPGLDTFAGPAFHSARWDHGARLEGRRVAVVGTGSTGVQITTALAGRASRLLLFQRTAQWVFPVGNHRYTDLTRRAHRRLPVLDRLFYRLHETLLSALLARALVAPGRRRDLIDRICRRHLETVADPELRRRLTPPDRPMCKRLIGSRGFYEAVQRDDVDVVTAPIDHVEPRGVVTADGVLHEIDVLVLATGFDAHAYLRPIRLTAPGGRTLEDAWRDGPRAYRTVALPGFPNFFMLMGPHSPIGNYSLIAIAEAQADYVCGWVRRYRAGLCRSVAPTQEATDRYNRALRDALPRTVWTSGCRSWYLGKDGLPELWPWTPRSHARMLAVPHLEEFTEVDALAPERG
ncbi:flavin-containing monooxygenase [Actinomadura namibiensis]|uniref:Cation diffusion facilitator CzcD-associated flavoprotein CzcO n=1 Tax=Actinomadura namibiensis TaxID=182080 RepID=A0A7W3LKJ1_ACTNM|nr:NAD(P)/FAD-dependent oxidoreductase [Actinomadura namibiensis]MBA8949807.1 cation diffusion facilitator CzcD-associated flavoprotein CzcO [Actinomadura namibiensis]